MDMQPNKVLQIFKSPKMLILIVLIDVFNCMSYIKMICMGCFKIRTSRKDILRLTLIYKLILNRDR